MDAATSLVYMMDMSPLILDETITPLAFVQGLMDNFVQDVIDRRPNAI